MARAALALACLLLALGAAAQELSPQQRAEDFETAWRAIDEGYAYFDGNRAAWRRAREAWKPRAAAAKSRAAFIAALEGALAELHDDHVGLSERTAASPRRVPDDTDIWAHWKNGEARVEAVRTYGEADAAGLKPGSRVLRIEDAPADQATRKQLGESAARKQADRDWALRHALAGPPRGTLHLQVADDRGAHPVDIERGAAARHNGPPIVARRMGERRDLGYIALRGGLGDPALVAKFEEALRFLRDTRGLILDLRDATGPGSREATLGILGLFTARKAPWQVREANGRRETDVVAPRGNAPYRAPVAVLVDRWTAGEGEALAAGLVAVARARLVGTPMAGLRGELREARLPHSGIVVRFPGEKTFTVDGTPREALAPHVAVNLAAPSGGPGDPILYQGLKSFDPR